MHAAKGREAPETIAAMTGLAAACGVDGSRRKAIKPGEGTLFTARCLLPAGDMHTIEAMEVIIPNCCSVDLAADDAKREAEVKTLLPRCSRHAAATGS